MTELVPAAPTKDAAKGGASPYRAGRAFEQQIRGRLNRRGYYVKRSYKSKGIEDLLAVGMPCVKVGVSALFIQAKRRGVISSEEWNKLYDLAMTCGGMPMVCTKLSAQTVGFYRLDAKREFGKRGRPWTALDPATLMPIEFELGSR